MSEPTLDEKELPNEHNIYPGDLLVVDGNVWRSPVSATVEILKRDHGFERITTCDRHGRGLAHLAL